MKLVEFIKDINNVDEMLTIYQKNELALESEIVLLDGQESTINIIVDGLPAFYLIEVFIAKDFIADWITEYRINPTNEEIAKRLFEFAMNDA